jgi:hypothetical protein
MTLEEFEKLEKSLVTYENIDEYIDKLFPEYVVSKQYYDAEAKELKYIHMGNLTLLAFENMDDRSDLDIAIRLMKLTNYVVNNFGGELQNMFCIEVFETIAGYRRGAHFAKDYLNGEALEIFHETTKFYHTHEFLEEYYQVFEMHPIYANEPQSLWKAMGDIPKPAMNPPQADDVLWDIRTNLETDETLIAGTLAYLAQQKIPPDQQIKTLRATHREIFAGYKDRLKKHTTETEDNKKYVKEVLNFIDDLGRIAVNIDIWFYNNFHK